MLHAYVQRFDVTVIVQIFFEPFHQLNRLFVHFNANEATSTVLFVCLRTNLFNYHVHFRQTGGGRQGEILVMSVPPLPTGASDEMLGGNLMRWILIQAHDSRRRPSSHARPPRYGSSGPRAARPLASGHGRAALLHRRAVVLGLGARKRQ
jgi:hypothetical protein